MSSPSVIAFVGHSGSQAPQAIQVSSMIIAMANYLKRWREKRHVVEKNQTEYKKVFFSIHASQGGSIIPQTFGLKL